MARAFELGRVYAGGFRDTPLLVGVAGANRHFGDAARPESADAFASEGSARHDDRLGNRTAGATTESIELGKDAFGFLVGHLRHERRRHIRRRDHRPRLGNDVADALNALPRIDHGGETDTTDGSGIAVFAHGLSWTPTTLIIRAQSPNGGTTNDRFVGVGGLTANSTNFTLGRSTAQSGNLLASASTTFNWVALG